MAAVGAASDQHEKGGLSGGNRSTVATDSPKCHIEITVRLSSAHRPAPRRPGVASANMSAMPHFTRAELEACRGRVVPDLIAPGLRLLFVGINPGLWTAATQTHFAHPGNRFYPALLRAGIIERPIDPAAGMSDADREYLIGRGVGITNLVARAIARADELTAAEYAAGGRELAARVARYAPHVVAVAGITAYRRAFGVRAATAGRQPEPLAGALLWVVPNPSGLNAHETIDSLAHAYAEPARAAGVI